MGVKAYMYEMFGHHSFPFGIEPSFGVEDLGVVTEDARGLMNDIGV